MADPLGDCLSKSKTKRDLGKDDHRDRRQNSYSNKYSNDDDRRHSSSLSSRNESHRDSKLHSYDRSDRDVDDSKSHYSRSSEDRRVSYKSDEMYRRSASHSRRYDDDRNTYESKSNSYRNSSNRDDRFYNGKFIGSENRGTIVSNNRSNYRQENDERLVKYNNRNNVSSGEDELVASLFQKIDYLSNQVDSLTQENERLRHNKSSNRNYLLDDNTEVDIIFRDKHLEEKFLPILQELVSRLIAGDRSVEELHELCSRPSLLEEQELGNELPEGDLFALDNSIAEPTEENAYIPKYDASFSEIMQKEAPESEEEKTKSIKFIPNACYNCGGDHKIFQCPIKIDHRKVSEMKKRNRPTTMLKFGRYHVNANRESDYKPGVISKELRKAMDLAPDQIPPYIYRMRVLDYPPGWLQEAVVESSGISLYGLDGRAEKEEENSGNGVQNSNGVQVQYDSTKFIDYPGFNVPLPPKVFDECLELGLPPMQPHHMRSYVEQFMTKPEVSFKRKRKFTVNESKPSKIQRVEEDMDVENDSDVGSIEFIPPLPEDAPPPPPPETITIEDNDNPVDPPPYDYDSRSGPDTPMSDSLMETLAPVVERFKLKHQDDATTKDSASPSLKDLEEIKKKLMLELGLASGSSSPAIPDGQFSYPSDVEDSPGVINLESSNDVSSFSEGSAASSPAPQTGLAHTVAPLKRTDSQCSQSKLVTLGTPSLSRHSSYQKLPEYDNFSKNVTSHMYFENLPNSTGTYQKMKKVIKKVKEKFNSLMQ